MVARLAMLFILRGATLALTRLITGRTQVPGLRVLIENDPIAWIFSADAFKSLFIWMGNVGLIALRTDGTPLATGIPASVLWWIGLTIFATWILMKTSYGNWIFGAGGDKNGARNVGVPVNRVKTSLFIGTAVCATIYACVQVLDAGSADTMRGNLKELEAIAAAVIGGVVLTGGFGTIGGIILGTIIFGIAKEAFFYIPGIDGSFYRVFLGAVLVTAALTNENIRKRIMGSV